MSYRIITHDGKAHLDELLGSALIALSRNEEPAAVDRMDPGEAAVITASGEIPENTYFVDCGLMFDRSRNLFDHHQDKTLDSAALLIFNEYFPGLKGTELHRFMELVSRVDTKGAMDLDDYERAGESRDYFAFGQDVLLRSFEESPLLILNLVAARFKSKIQFEKAREEAAVWLEEPGNVRVTRLKHIRVLEYVKKPPSELVPPLKAEINDTAEKKGISAVYSFDDKEKEIRAIYRTDFGHNSLDLSRTSPRNPVFIHHSGFFMKFVPADEEEWKRLIKESVV